MNIYEKSLQAIKDYDKILSVKEWNKIAKEHGYLSAKVLTIISGKNFKSLSVEVRNNFSHFFPTLV